MAVVLKVCLARYLINIALVVMAFFSPFYQLMFPMCVGMAVIILIFQLRFTRLLKPLKSNLT